MSNRATRRRNFRGRKSINNSNQTAFGSSLRGKRIAAWILTALAFCSAWGGVYALSSQNKPSATRQASFSPLSSPLFGTLHSPSADVHSLPVQSLLSRQIHIASLPQHESVNRNVASQPAKSFGGDEVVASFPNLRQIGSATTSGALNPFLFAGQQWDEASQTYYMRARYYSPQDGRFLSQDPLAGRNQDPVSLHRYLYAHDDPINHVDPSGKGDETLGGLSASTSTAIGLAGLSASATILAGQYIRQNGLPEIYLPQQTGPSPAITVSQVAAQTLPNLNGKSQEEAEQELNDAGFIQGNTSAGGYARWRHPDGSDVYIRPNGEVIRLGPKVAPTGGGKMYHPHYDPDGQITQEHNTGETINNGSNAEAPDNGDDSNIPNT